MFAYTFFLHTGVGDASLAIVGLTAGMVSAAIVGFAEAAIVDFAP